MSARTGTPLEAGRGNHPLAQSGASTTSANDPGARRFRALRVGGKRKAFSLEPEFWQILEEAAAAAGLRIGDYIGTLTQGLSGGNASSALRRNAATWLLKNREQTKRQDPVALARRVVEAVSIPALVIDDRKFIVAHNAEFLALGTAPASEDVPERLRVVQLHLAASVASIIDRLVQAGDHATRMQYVLDFGYFRRAGALKVSLLDRGHDRTFLLCVLEKSAERG